MNIMSLAFKSLRNRKFTVMLTVLSIAISVALLLGVERIRTESRESFTNTVSGTDLLVGARSSQIGLLLYSVFHIGDATNNISWESYQDIINNPVVDWTIPVSLGDSHKGHRVVGTNTDMFKHYRFGDDEPLSFKNGKPFNDLYDAVIGAEVARERGYKIGDPLILSHGTAAIAMQEHDNKPFVITGIMNPTGTPLDRSILISLEGIEALHVDWQSGAAPIRGLTVSADKARALNLQPTAVTATFVGLKSRMATFRLQRQINEYPQEALLAILPGVALQQLWGLIGVAEKALLAVSICVVFAGLIGLLTSILTSLNERRREMAILRSVGARRWHIFVLMVLEAVLTGIASCILGLIILYIGLGIASLFLPELAGIHITISPPSLFEIKLMLAVISASALLGVIPAWRAYKNSLADGLTIRV